MLLQSALGHFLFSISIKECVGEGRGCSSSPTPERAMTFLAVVQVQYKNSVVVVVVVVVVCVCVCVTLLSSRFSAGHLPLPKRGSVPYCHTQSMYTVVCTFHWSTILAQCGETQCQYHCALCMLHVHRTLRGIMHRSQVRPVLPNSTSTTIVRAVPGWATLLLYTM